MTVRDKERSISFLSEITNYMSGIESVWNRIDHCEIPGMYDVEFVGVSLGDRSIKSITVYLIESPFIENDKKHEQRGEVLKFYDRLFDCLLVGEVFAPSGCALRIDPSFKSSDSEFIFRLDPQFRGKKDLLPICLERVGKYMFPGNPEVFNFIKSNPAPGRFAVELDSAMGIGRKIRLYYYDNYKYKDECFRGVTVNEDGEVSREKHYLGVHSPIWGLKEEIEKITGSDFAKRLLRTSIYQDYDMSLFFLAHERSEYGVDAKLYFRNEQIAPERLRIKGVVQ